MAAISVRRCLTIPCRSSRFPSINTAPTISLKDKALDRSRIPRPTNSETRASNSRTFTETIRRLTHFVRATPIGRSIPNQAWPPMAAHWATPTRPLETKSDSSKEGTDKRQGGSRRQSTSPLPEPTTSPSMRRTNETRFSRSPSASTVISSRQSLHARVHSRATPRRPSPSRRARTPSHLPQPTRQTSRTVSLTRCA